MSYVVAIECADGREVVAGQMSSFKKAEERAAQICHVLYHKDALYNDLQAQGYDPRNVIVRAKAGKIALAAFPFDPNVEHQCGHDHDHGHDYGHAHHHGHTDQGGQEPGKA